MSKVGKGKMGGSTAAQGRSPSRGEGASIARANFNAANYYDDF